MPKMRYDHFEKNPQQRGTSDFNFNINFGDMPQVAEMAATLGKMLKEREQQAELRLFHNPIPPEWLHLTEWSGSTKDFTLDRAVPMLDVTPKEPFQRINAMARSAVQQVIGIDTVPEPKEPYDPHITTVYPTTYERTEAAESVVNSIHVEPVKFTVGSIDLVKQSWDNQENPNHYEWKVLKKIPIGTR
jgi:hypothetical protein